MKSAIKRLPFPGRRRGTAGIIAAVIMFAMLFTVGTSYFMFINTTNQLYVKSQNSRFGMRLAPVNEALTITALLTGGNIGITVTNTGAMNANVTAIYVLDSSNNVLKCDGRGLPAGTCSNATPALPQQVNVQATTGTINTGYAYTSGTDTIKVFTATGGVYSTTYPPPAGQTIPNALSAGAIGDLFLTFQDFKSWTVKNSGCTATTDSSGWCLNTKSSAFVVAGNNQCLSGTTCLVFSVRVTDLNSQQDFIQLNQFALFYQLNVAGANAKAGYQPWFIVSNSSSGTINAHFHTINLTYNVPQTLVFASNQCIKPSTGPDLSPSTCTTLSSGSSGWLQAPALSCSEPCGQQGVNFISTSGWEQASLSLPKNLVLANVNYDQNLAYVSTLFT